MVGVSVNDLVNEWHQVIVFWTRFFHIFEISTNEDGALSFHDRYKVRNPRYISDKIDEPNLWSLSITYLISLALEGCN